MNNIRSNIYIGDQWDAINVKQLDSCGITHILNVSNVCVPKFKINKQIIMEDTYEQDLIKPFEEAYSFIESSLNNNGIILIHCSAGKSRSAAILILYLMKKEGLSFEDAYSQVLQARPIIEINRNFINQLKNIK